MERHSSTHIARPVPLAGLDGWRSWQPRQTQGWFLSLVVSGGNQRHHSRERRMVLGAAETSPELVGVGGHLLSVHRPQRKSHFEPFPRYARPDFRRPSRGVEQDGAGGQRYVCHRPRRRRQIDCRQRQRLAWPVAGARRKSRYLVGSRAGSHQRHIDIDAAGARDFQCRFVAGSGGSSQPENRIVRH